MITICVFVSIIAAENLPSFNTDAMYGDGMIPRSKINAYLSKIKRLWPVHFII